MDHISFDHTAPKALFSPQSSPLSTRASDQWPHQAADPSMICPLFHLSVDQSIDDDPAFTMQQPIRSIDRNVNLTLPDSRGDPDEQQNPGQMDGSEDLWRLGMSSFPRSYGYPTSIGMVSRSAVEATTPEHLFTWKVNATPDIIPRTSIQSNSLYSFDDASEIISTTSSSQDQVQTGLTSDHARYSVSPNHCNQCEKSFPSNKELAYHAKVSQHSPYSCNCGKSYSRLDVLARHINVFHNKAHFPCPLCKKHRGASAFRRRDHLTQHLKGYHNVVNVEERSSDSEISMISIPPPRTYPGKTLFCPHQLSCPQAYISFDTKGELTKHFRDIHDESTFPCPEPRCSRIGGRGFFRMRDLLRHQGEHHSYQAS